MEAGALQAPAGLSRISIATPLLRLRTDDQLVALFRAGNDEAFQVIFDRYRQRLFAYTRQMLAGSRQDAEDALQDVFLRAYGALRANDRPVSLRAWLYRVAHNRCIDQLRRPVPASADVFDVSRAPLKDPIEESQRREDLRRLVEDVRRLPEAQRSALLMREMEGLSYQELAAALDVTVPAVKSLLVRARIGLVEAIEARDTACVEIRNDLLASYDKGVRATGKARRHLRDCAGCRTYRTELRSVQRGLGALSPGHSGPLGMLAKVFGIGGGAGGAAAGGTAVVGGGGAAVVGGGAATATACKVAALVCSAALVTGAASQVEKAVRHVVHLTPAQQAATPAGGARHAAGATHASLTAPHIVRLPTRSTAGATAAAAVTTVAADKKPADPVATSGRDEPSAAVAAADHEAQVITPDDEVYADPRAPAQGATTDPGAGAGVTGAGAGDTVGGGVKAPDEPAAPVEPAAGTTSGAGAGTAPASGTTGTTATGTSSTAPASADGQTAPATSTAAGSASTAPSGSSASATLPALTAAATATGSR